jgi:hypothetical protein
MDKGNLAIAQFILSIAMTLAGLIWWLGTRNAEVSVTARDLDRLEKSKADKSEVQAVDKRIDDLVEKFGELKSAIRDGMGRIEQKLDAEHKLRSAERDDLQFARSELAMKVAALEAAVFGHQMRRAEDKP